MVTIPYDKLVVLGDTSTTREKIFHHVVASAFLPARSTVRCSLDHAGFTSKLFVV